MLLLTSGWGLVRSSGGGDARGVHVGSGSVLGRELARLAHSRASSRDLWDHTGV